MGMSCSRHGAPAVARASTLFPKHSQRCLQGSVIAPRRQLRAGNRAWAAAVPAGRPQQEGTGQSADSSERCPSERKSGQGNEVGIESSPGASLPQAAPSYHLLLITAEAGSAGKEQQQRQRPEVIASAPELQWGQGVALPLDLSLSVSSAAASDLQQQGDDGGRQLPVIVVWLSGPSGPAAARIGPEELKALCSAGRGGILAIKAAPVAPVHDVKDGELLLQCCMHSQEATEELPTEEAGPASSYSSQGPTQQQSAAQPGPVRSGARLSDSVLARALSAAGIAWVLSVASWVLVLLNASSQVAEILRLVAFLALNLAGIVGYIVMAFIKLPQESPAAAVQKHQERPLEDAAEKRAVSAGKSPTRKLLAYTQWTLTLVGCAYEDAPGPSTLSQG